MLQYRQVLVRLRQGDSDRDIARAGLMGPEGGRFPRARSSPRLARSATALPDDAESPRRSARRAGRAQRSPRGAPSSRVERWHDEGISGVAIHAVLCREHGYRGSYPRYIGWWRDALRAACGHRAVVQAPGEAAQVDSAPDRCPSIRPGRVR